MPPRPGLHRHLHDPLADSSPLDPALHGGSRDHREPSDDRRSLCNHGRPEAAREDPPHRRQQFRHEPTRRGAARLSGHPAQPAPLQPAGPGHRDGEPPPMPQARDRRDWVHDPDAGAPGGSLPRLGRHPAVPAAHAPFPSRALRADPARRGRRRSGDQRRSRGHPSDRRGVRHDHGRAGHEVGAGRAGNHLLPDRGQKRAQARGECPRCGSGLAPGGRRETQSRYPAAPRQARQQLRLLLQRIF